jgi:heme-degrading monooxygenase HmoA
MFTVIYRWRIHPETEEVFRRAWRHRTKKVYAILGSFGSRLHRELDGTLCAIALWPSREAWLESERGLPDDAADSKTYADAIIERLPTLTMEAIDDLWKPQTPI